MDVNFGQLNLGFIQLRGVRNLEHYAAAEVVSFLTKRRVKLRFLVDRDESNTVHFARLKDEFGQNATINAMENAFIMVTKEQTILGNVVVPLGGLARFAILIAARRRDFNGVARLIKSTVLQAPEGMGEFRAAQDRPYR